MSLTTILALCILGFDFLIYAFCRRIYGDNRRELARQIADLRKQSTST
jgi:hypothetical protein